MTDIKQSFFESKNITKTDLISNHLCKFDRFDQHNYKPYHIIWPHTIIISENDLLNLDDAYFELRVGGSVIWKIPMILILNLFPPYHIDSSYCISIPYTYFWHDKKKYATRVN